MNNTPNGEVTTPSLSGEENDLQDTAAAGEPTGGNDVSDSWENQVVDPGQEDLEEILAPLVDVMNRHYRDGWNGRFRFTNGRDCDIQTEEMGAMIQLPPWPAEHPLMARALLTILRRTASAPGWLPPGPEGDPDMVALDFSISTRTMCTPGTDSFLREVYLLINHTYIDETDPCMKQVRLLVEFLADPKNLVPIGPDDLRIF